jgi:hypothetical protein
MPWIITSFIFVKCMFSETLLAIIIRIVVTFLPASLTSVKRLIMSITGYFLANWLDADGSVKSVLTTGIVVL